MADRPHHRPMTPGGGFFAEIAGGADPAQLSEAGDRPPPPGPRRQGGSTTPALAERVVHLADSEGLETLAEVWSGAPADTLAGSLWRLFLLRSWVHAAPAAGRPRVRRRPAPRARSPTSSPGWPTRPAPTSCATMVDDVLRGIAGGDFAGPCSARRPSPASSRPAGPRWARPRTEDDRADAGDGRAARGRRTPGNQRTGWPEPLDCACECVGLWQPRVPTMSRSSGLAP